jgi:hypothetical protein
MKSINLIESYPIYRINFREAIFYPVAAPKYLIRNTWPTEEQEAVSLHHIDWLLLIGNEYWILTILTCNIFAYVFLWVLLFFAENCLANY